jgi:adenylyltransferase/sulfurtransferase
MLTGLTDGQTEVEVQALSMWELVDNLETDFPGIKTRLCDEDGALRSMLVFFLNNKDIRFLDGADTQLMNGDHVSIVPLIAGGASSQTHIDRYSRQVTLPYIGVAGQKSLLRSSVLVAGCGALGTVTATQLVRAGVGKVRIVDRDFIEYHNLQRQVLFDEEDVRDQIPKAMAAERHLRKVNSSVEVEGIVDDINYGSIQRHVQGMDIILDGLDNLETRYLINDAALKNGIPWVYGAAIASHGMTMTILPGETPCLRCIFPHMPEQGSSLTCDTAGVISSAPFIVASLQFVEAVKILIGASDQINRTLTSIDVWDGGVARMEVQSSETCPACHGVYEFLRPGSGTKTASLCGQDSVQILNPQKGRLSFPELAQRLEPLGPVSYNDFMLRFVADSHEMVAFPDGRAIVKGTSDQAVARGLYAKYIGA